MDKQEKESIMKVPKLYATDALAAVRMKKGYTQVQIVNLLKMYDPTIKLSTYAKLETGERPATIERIVLIAATLHKSPWELFKSEALTEQKEKA
jgi:transcriptional regulator with XRE-family HTH domain